MKTLLPARTVRACVSALTVVAERAITGITIRLLAVSPLRLPLILLRTAACSILLIEVGLRAPALLTQIALIRTRARLAGVARSVLLIEIRLCAGSLLR